MEIIYLQAREYSNIIGILENWESHVSGLYEFII